MNTEWTVILKPGEGGRYTSTIAESPGAVSKGDTPEEATEMVIQALEELSLIQGTLSCPASLTARA